MFDFLDPAFSFSVFSDGEKTTVREFWRGANFDYIREIVFHVEQPGK